MNKILKVILIIFLIFILVGGVLVVYLYYFHSFYNIRFCISNNINDTEIPCQNNSFCRDISKEKILKLNEVKELPDFVKNKIDNIIEKSVYCENTCKIKEIYGEGLGDIGHVDSCKSGEEEIVIEVTGKRAVKFAGKIISEI